MYTGKAHLTDFFPQTSLIWNENCLVPQGPGSDPQPGDLAIKKRLIWIGRWVLGRDGMRGILKSLVSTQKWHFVCGLIIFNDDSSPQAVYSFYFFLLKFIYISVVNGGSFRTDPLFLQLLRNLRFYFRSFDFASQIIWSSLLLDCFSWPLGLWLFNWLLLEEHNRLVKRRQKLGSSSSPLRNICCFFS